MTRQEAIKRFRNGVDKQLKWTDFSFDFEMLLHSIYDEFEAREMLLSTKDVYCDDCKHYLSADGKFPLEPCGECNRFYEDKFERKEDV